ncbi:hypothetical protein ABZY04_41535, partial [Streptomyces sp. NPDC002922]
SVAADGDGGQIGQQGEGQYGRTRKLLGRPALAAVALIDRVEGVVVVCDPREVHRSDLERIREIIGAAGGSVLGTLLHPGQGRIERRSRKKSSRRRNGGGRQGTDGQDGRGGSDGPEHTGDPTETLGLRTFDTPAARR